MRRTLLGAVGAVGGAFMVLVGHTLSRPTNLATPPAEHRPAGGVAGTGAGSGVGGTGSGPLTFSGDKNVTGPVVQTMFGPVQVEVSITGGKITDVQALQTPNFHRRSIAINQYARPILRQEVLAAQSADIDLVSGATFTSEAYIQSLQAALDQAAK